MKAIGCVLRSQLHREPIAVLANEVDVVREDLDRVFGALNALGICHRLVRVLEKIMRMYLLLEHESSAISGRIISGFLLDDAYLLYYQITTSFSIGHF